MIRKALKGVYIIMKKLLVMILAALLVCGCILPHAMAEAQGDYQYTVKEDGTAEITKVNKDCKDSVIPAELDGHKVTSIGAHAFSTCKNMKIDAIPEGITAIGEGAFMYCDKIQSIKLPDSLTTIGEMAFSFCGNLQSVNIPDSVTEIGEGVFMNSPKLKAIEISRENPAYVFNSKALISKKDRVMICYLDPRGGDYEIPWGITRIGLGAFCGSKVKSVVIPDSVVSVGPQAFWDCKNMMDIYIPHSVTSIDNQAFLQCAKLKTVAIPDSVTEIGKGVFSWCKNLETVQISADHPVYELKDSLLIRKADGRLISALPSIKGSCEIPDGVQSIEDMAFSGCEKMKELIIPASVKEITGFIFTGSNRLVCKVTAGTYAEQYCEEYGVKHETISK